MTKELTFVFPKRVGIVDMTYYWRTETGETIKTVAFFDCKDYDDGEEINCFKPLEEHKA